MSAPEIDPIHPDHQIPSSQEASDALDSALGLEPLAVKLPGKTMRELEQAATSFHVPVPHLARNILRAYGQQTQDRTRAHDVTLEVIAERARQDAKWGGPAHDDRHSLNDFCGFIELRADEILSGFDSTQDARRRLIQIAALAVAAVEMVDRKLDWLLEDASAG